MRSKVVGITEDLDDANLQQFVNTKTQRPIDFSYSTNSIDGIKIGIFEIPVQERPVYLTRDYGRLEKDKVYLKRGSSTAIASPDEIKQMGITQMSEATPDLTLEWGDLKRNQVFSSPCTIHSLLLNPQLHKDTFVSNSIGLDLSININYSKEVIDFTFETAFFKPLDLRLFNRSQTVARRVRFVGSVPQINSYIFRNWEDLADRPSRNFSMLLSNRITPLAEQLQQSPKPYIRKSNDNWEVIIDFGDVRPRDDVWTTQPLFIVR